MEKVRIDKWLWSVRIFKTRTVASNYLKNGKVLLNGKQLKPAFNIEGGEILTIKKDGIIITLKVLSLIQKRVSSVLAQKHYQDLTPDEEKLKRNQEYIINTIGEFRESGLGRPTKTDRRAIDKLKEVSPFAKQEENWFYDLLNDGFSDNEDPSDS